MAVKTFGDYLFGFLGSYLFDLEMVAIAAGLGYWQDSWWVFGGAMLVLVLLSKIKALAILLCVLFSIAWGAAGFWAAGFLQRTDAQWVIGIFVFLIALGIHGCALRYMNVID